MGALALESSLYERDYYAWLVKQAAHIRARHFDQLDCEALAEELEDVGRSERRAVESSLKNLLLHLLKWARQPQRRSGSWRDSIDTARDAIGDLLQESPSLRPHLPEFVARQYARARHSAANQTGIAEVNFATTCPFRLDDILDPAFFPEAGEQQERGSAHLRRESHRKVRVPKKKAE
ncbi:MAG: DUF29 domain-containing protein [Deltaproteobacteria bacterium]|nr:DUF29 domain-containing protein [Deltaproteobacteria bacterium]